MIKILSIPFSVIFYLLFGLTIVVFHPIQWVCFNWFGYRAHKKSVDILNWFLLRCLNVLGTTFKIEKPDNFPENVPIIIVSNHQSMWDIPPIIWYLRKIHPKFISKKELGKGIPSISYNLRHGGSVLIDRKNNKQSIVTIAKFAEYLKKNNRSGVIFPEGTRSKNGIPKSFKRAGLEILLKRMPNAYVLPITINNSWKLQRWGNFPLQIGVRLGVKVHPALKVSDFEREDLMENIEKIITKDIILPK